MPYGASLLAAHKMRPYKYNQHTMWDQHDRKQILRG